MVSNFPSPQTLVRSISITSRSTRSPNRSDKYGNVPRFPTGRKPQLMPSSGWLLNLEISLILRMFFRSRRVTHLDGFEELIVLSTDQGPAHLVASDLAILGLHIGQIRSLPSKVHFTTKRTCNIHQESSCTRIIGSVLGCANFGWPLTL